MLGLFASRALRAPAARAGALWLLSGLLLSGCRPAPPTGLAPDLVQGEAALAEVRALVAIGPRAAGTPGARQAAEHLLGRLRALGIAASLESFTVAGPAGPLALNNVMGIIPGQTPAGAARAWVVLGSHYDTKAGVSDTFEGANDSGSSCGLLLELARLIKASAPLPFNTLLAFFDGEECQNQYGPQDGLHGSRRLAAALQRDGRARQVRAVIILDMVGDRDLSITLPRNGTPQLTAAVLRAAQAVGARDKFSLYRATLLDDHQPFLEAGMPAVVIIDFEYGSRPGLNDYWHTPADTLAKLSAESLGIVGRVVAQLLNEIALSAQPLS